MRINQSRTLIIKAVKLAAVIELPLFVSLLACLLVFDMGPHDAIPMILLMTQIVGLSAMSPLDLLSSNNPFVLTAVWSGILAVQITVLALLIYSMLRAVSNEG